MVAEIFVIPKFKNFKGLGHLSLPLQEELFLVKEKKHLVALEDGVQLISTALFFRITTTKIRIVIF